MNKILKNYLLQNYLANFNQTSHKSFLGARIQVCANKGALLLPKGDYNEIAKIHRRILNIVFCRTTGPISTKHDTMYLCVKRTQVFIKINSKRDRDNNFFSLNVMA